jgi:hypothetical protein
MRDALTPAEFDMWIAFRQIHQDKMERLIWICKNGFMLLANAQGAKIEASDLDPQPAEEHEQTVSPEQAAMIAKMSLGNPGNPHGNRDR